MNSLTTFNHLINTFTKLVIEGQDKGLPVKRRPQSKAKVLEIC